jgi:type IV pilus assembly protein PilM
MLACEIAADRVIAARAGTGLTAVEAHAARKLAPGTLTPALSGANITNAAALRDAISSALDSVASKGRDVIAVLPDNAVRVLLVDFEALPDRKDEADGVVRFRLRKSLPFDVDKAALSYHAYRAAGGIRVLAAVCPGDVLGDYEEAFRSAGYQPGIVLPSILAVLGTVDASRPTLVVKVDPGVVVIGIADGDEVRLLRTVEMNTSQLGASALAEQVYPSAIYFEDTFGTQIDRVLLAGTVSVPDAAEELRAQTGARVEEIVATGEGGESLGEPAPRSSLAGVVGALTA